MIDARMERSAYETTYLPTGGQANARKKRKREGRKEGSRDISIYLIVCSVGKSPHRTLDSVGRSDGRRVRFGGPIEGTFCTTGE